jgi:hypothetical protein
MSPEGVRQALETTRHWKRRFQVHLTGGEPFLNFPLLLHAVEAARALDIPIYVETNAGWCVREGLVRERFETLQEAGLRRVLISCSPFHAARIPPERTFLGIRLALEIFGPEGVIVYLPAWVEQLSKHDIQNEIPLEAHVQHLGKNQAGRLFWHGYGLISGGRSGYRLGYLIEGKPAAAYRSEICRWEMLYAHHSHFDLYGNFIPSFCGGLSLGQWQRLPSLVEDFQAGRYPDLIAILVESGPFGLFERARQSSGYKELEEGYAGKCHLCVDVRRHLVQQGETTALQPLGFYDNF